MTVKLLTPTEAAERMRVSRSMIYLLVDQKLLHAIRIGGKNKRGKILLDEEEIEEFIESCRGELRAE